MDFVTNHNPKALYSALLAVADTPEYVKSAAVITEDDTQALHYSMFADMQHRELPTHTKEATYLSAATFFGEGQRRGAAVLSRIKAAAAIFDIEADVTTLGASVTKRADAPEEVFALVVTSDKLAGYDGEPCSMYRVDSPEHLLMSADQMVKDAAAGLLPLNLYRESAVKLVKLADAVGMTDIIPGEVVARGTVRLPDFEKAAATAGRRGQYAHITEEASDLYSEIIKSAKAEFEASAGDEAVVEKWAAAWAALDSAAGIDYALSGAVDPYTAFFSGPSIASISKLASSVVVVADVLVPAPEFQMMNHKVASCLFSEQEAETIKEACSANDTKEACALVATLSPEAQQRLLGELI